MEEGQEANTWDIDIPMDVVDEILCRLPVKSLLRLRCVCKSWKSKISKADFIHKHRKQARRGEATPMAFDKDRISKCHVCTMRFNENSNNSNDLQPVSVTRIFDVLRGQLVSSSLFATCDELWLVIIWNQLYLWNVSTRMYKKLPGRPPGWLDYDRDNIWDGVGYDPIGDDYKVLISPGAWRPTGGIGGLETQLYSLKKNSWKKAPGGGFPTVKRILFRPRRHAVCLNGSLHWIIYPFQKEDPIPDFPVGHYDYMSLDYAIVSFDLWSGDEYKEVASPPNSWRSRMTDHVGVEVLKGMLCVFLSYHSSLKLELWLMKDYGVKESWTKLYEICYRVHPIFVPQYILSAPLLKRFQFNLPRPLYLFDNGDLLIHTDETETILIYKHDDDGGVTRIINVPGSYSLYDSILYVETLVLLH